MFLTTFEDNSADCIQETDFLHLYPSLSISEFLLLRTYHHPIIFLHLTLSLLPFGLAPIRVRRSSHAGDTQDLTRLSPHKAPHCLLRVDAFIGLKLLLCIMPAVYSHTQAVIPPLTTVCGHVMQSV